MQIAVGGGVLAGDGLDSSGRGSTSPCSRRRCGTRDIVGRPPALDASRASRRPARVYLVVDRRVRRQSTRRLGVLRAPGRSRCSAVAFAAPMAAYAGDAGDRREHSFRVIRFVILPMFLFSGTFFPVSRLPLPLEWLAYATPLWHGVELCARCSRSGTCTRAARARPRGLPARCSSSSVCVWRCARYAREAARSERVRVRRQPRATPLRAQPHGLPGAPG